MCHAQVLVQNSLLQPFNLPIGAMVKINGVEIRRTARNWEVPGEILRTAPWIKSMLNYVTDCGAQFVSSVELELVIKGQRVDFASIGEGDILCLEGKALQLRRNGNSMTAIPVNTGCESIFTKVGPRVHRN